MPDQPRAFTSKYTQLSNKLINEVNVIYSGKSTMVKAQWDTGASSSCISHDVVSQLSLTPTGVKYIQTPSGLSQVNTYLIDVILPNDVYVNDLVVCDSEIGAQGIGMLVGMDVINLGDFAVSNYAGQTVFSFRIPSQKTTNYVVEIDKKLSHGNGKKKNKNNKKRKK